MARKTTTTYICDSCGATVERPKDLRRFVLLQGENPRAPVIDARLDLCDECEPRFLAAVEPFFSGDNVSHLHAMSREEE
jgi:hypothetical protein